MQSYFVSTLLHWVQYINVHCEDHSYSGCPYLVKTIHVLLKSVIKMPGSRQNVLRLPSSSHFDSSNPSIQHWDDCHLCKLRAALRKVAATVYRRPIDAASRLGGWEGWKLGHPKLVLLPWPWDANEQFFYALFSVIFVLYFRYKFYFYIPISVCQLDSQYNARFV